MQSKPNNLHIDIACFTGDSGLSDYSVSLAKALSESATTSVITSTTLPFRFESMGFDVYRIFRRSRHFAIDVVKFIFLVKKRKPNWIVFQGPLKFAGIDALVVRLLKMFGVHCAITVHDVLPHYPKSWSATEFSFYYRSFNKVIAHSEAAAQALVVMGIKKPILVVPHGIYDIFNLSNLNKNTAREYFPLIHPGSTVVLFFGNLESRKGLWQVINAAQKFAGQGGFTFVIAGAPHLGNSGPGAEERLNKAKQLDNVIVHDRRIEFEAVERYFALADIVALPYLEGTTSGVLKLALAFGKPVIATRIGDFPEQVPEGAGIFIDPDNIDVEFTQALVTMRNQLPSFTHAMQNSNSKAQWPVIAEQVLNFLKADV